MGLNKIFINRNKNIRKRKKRTLISNGLITAKIRLSIFGIGWTKNDVPVVTAKVKSAIEDVSGSNA